MIKLLGAIMLICSATTIGFLFSKRLNNRKKFLMSFESFLSSVQTYIRYDNSRIETVIEKSLGDESLDSLKEAVCKDLDKPFSTRFKNWTKNLSPFLGLTTDDKRLLDEFGAELGVTDLNGQIKHIELYKTLFSKAVNEAQSEITQKSKLYKMTGFCMGAVIALLII